MLFNRAHTYTSGKSGIRVRSLYICMIALAVAVILIVQPVAALPIMQVPYFRAGPVWSLAPSEIANLEIIEMNTCHLAASDSEAFAVSFVPAGAGCGRFAIAPVDRADVEPDASLRPVLFLRDFSRSMISGTVFSTRSPWHFIPTLTGGPQAARSPAARSRRSRTSTGDARTICPLPG